LAIAYARSNGLPISVHGGGHGVTGAAMAEGGVCIDLRGMKAIAVDPLARTVRAEGGVTWGEFDAATQAHGLAITGGRNPTTGIAGLTLGSGSGWAERKLGYTCDDLLMVEMVTADGRQVIASETENPDLFWALHGGGGNFGVVTAFHFRLHEMGPMITGGLLIYPAAMAGALMRHYREYMRHAPDEVGGGLILGTAPAAEFVPEPARGQPVAIVLVAHVGSAAQAEADLAPLRRFGPPAADLVQPMPYVELQKITEPGNPWGQRNYWTADFYRDLPDEAIDTLVGRATRPVSPLSVVVVVPGGGAPSRVDEDATPLGGRKDVGGRRRRRGQHRLHARAVRGNEALDHRPGLPELDRRRGPGPHRPILRAGQICPLARDQGAMGPGEHLPAQPEHPPFGRGGVRPSRRSLEQWHGPLAGLATLATLSRKRARVGARCHYAGPTHPLPLSRVRVCNYSVCGTTRPSCSVTMRSARRARS
jgi:hypothetical protein